MHMCLLIINFRYDVELTNWIILFTFILYLQASVFDVFFGVSYLLVVAGVYCAWMHIWERGRGTGEGEFSINRTI